MQTLQQAAQLISFLRRESHESARNSWVRWRELTEDIYGFDIDPNQIIFLINTGKVAGKELKSRTDASQCISALKKSEQVVTASLVELYIKLEEEHRERISSQLTEIWSELKASIKLTESEETEVNSQVDKWIEANKEGSFFTPISIPASIVTISTDYFLRWFCLLYYNLGGFDNWAFFEGGADDWFVTIQIIIIGPVVMLFAVLRDRYIVRRMTDLFKELDVERLKPRVVQNPWNYALLAFYVTSGMFIFLSLEALQAPTLVVIITGIFLLIPYYMILLKLFSKSIPRPKLVLDQLELTRSRILKTNLTPDENDEEIVTLGVNLRSVNELMNAFVLEAALFGALAFSGFLQIIASDYFSIDEMNRFTSDMYHVLENIVLMRAFDPNQVQELLSKVGLLALMCYESLFCSVFFLSVIASRLRFNDLTDFIDKALRLASTFNVKEEALLSSGATLKDERVSILNHKIRQRLQEGYRTQDDIEPIMTYMRFFRTLGITTFFIIIITGGLFISIYVSLILLFISVLSLGYFKLDEAALKMKYMLISMQEFFFSIEKKLGWISWGVIGFAILVNTLDVGGASLMMILGFLFITLTYLFNLFVPEIVEVKEKDGDFFRSASTFYIIQQKLFKAGMSFFFLGYGFKMMHWPGASILLILGVGFLAIYFLLTKKIKDGPKLVGYIIGFAIATGFLGVLFKFQHWPGGSILYWINTITIPIGTVLIIIYWNRMRPLVRKTQIIFAVLVLMVQFDFTRYAVGFLNFNYAKFQQQSEWSFHQHMVVWPEESPDQLTANGEPIMDSVIVHAKKITALMGMNRYVNANNLAHTAWDILQKYDDPEILNEALLWAEYASKADRWWWSYATQARLLYKLERYEEAEPIAAEAEEIAKLENEGVRETEALLTKIRVALSETKVDSLTQE